MLSRAYITVATRSHWAWVKVLAESLRRAEPDVPLHVCVADATPDSLPQEDGLSCCCPADLQIPDMARFCFQYSPFELCCALKPFVIRHVLQSYKRVIYLDSDIWVERPLKEAWDELTVGNILLSPHRLAPLARNWTVTLNEKALLIAGPFNAGFIGIRNSEVGCNFLNWWAEKVEHDCIVDTLAHSFVDQNWLAMVPCFFDGSVVLRHPGYNVAVWNVGGRMLVRDPLGTLYIDDVPLVFFHFTGFDPKTPERLSVHEKYQFENNVTLDNLQRMYADRLRLAGWDGGGKGYGWGVLTDYTPVRLVWRELIRTRHEAFMKADNPFDSRWKSLFIDTEHNFESGRVDMRWRHLRELVGKLTLHNNRLEAEAGKWKAAYARLASAFPVHQLLTMRNMWRKIR
ncbi:MAG: hypothetical protein WCI03_01135 [bacterium]